MNTQIPGNPVTAMTWRAVILTFESKTCYENPFLGVTITASFTGPDGEKLVREAYWDGENIYRVQVALTAAGTWNYVLNAPAETGLDQICGTIECVSYDGDLPIYQHGFLRVSDDHRYLTYADGTPFFWLGDTHWEFSYKEKWDWSNHPQMDSMFKGMIDKRFDQGYSIYQTNLRSDAMLDGKKLYWQAPGIPNVDFYQNELDRRMAYLADHGLVNALGLEWFMAIRTDEDIETYKNLARYIIARYGAYPMVWTLAGEVGGYDKSRQKFYIDAWRPVALTIRDFDTYNQLQTVHYTNERPFACYYHDEDWYDFTLNQAGHGDFVVSIDDYKAFLKSYGDKPFVEGEALYEFVSTLEENGTRLCTADMLRRVAYLTIQVGGCGYTYGAQGIWDTYYEKGDPNPMSVFNRYGITWYEAIDGIGGEQMGYMKKFYEEQHFEEFYPYSAGSDAVGDPFGKKMPLITVTKDGRRMILYYPQATRRSGTLTGMKNGKYNMQWFDPRTGRYMDNVSSFTVTDGSWELPKKPDPEDWVLVVTIQ